MVCRGDYVVFNPSLALASAVHAVARQNVVEASEGCVSP